MNFGISVPSYLGLGTAFATAVTAVLHVLPITRPLAAPFKRFSARHAHFGRMTVLCLCETAHLLSVKVLWRRNDGFMTISTNIKADVLGGRSEFRATVKNSTMRL